MFDFLTNKVFYLRVWQWVTLALFLLGGLAAWYITAPVHASWRYGACKAFLQQYVRFPDTINVRQGGETRGSAVLSFSDINSFGAQQVRLFECHFSTDARGGQSLSRITLDRKALPDDIVKKFNAQLPILAGQELDTALPEDLPESLEDLKQD